MSSASSSLQVGHFLRAISYFLVKKAANSGTFQGVDLSGRSKSIDLCLVINIAVIASLCSIIFSEGAYNRSDGLEFALILNTELAVRVNELLDDQEFLLVIGGDHSIAMGTVAGAAAHYRNRDEEMGLIWFDAHGDMNIPGGVRYREAHLLLEYCADSRQMTSMEVVELNPFMDHKNVSAERTLCLITSALGKSIL